MQENLHRVMIKWLKGSIIHFGGNIMKDLLHKIENSYKDFSAGQKRIADLFKENQIVLAFFFFL